MSYSVSIYALSDPESGSIRYVGRTCRLLKRFGEHLREQKVSHKSHWIRALKHKGLKPIMDILETISSCSDEDWQEAERFWIAYLKFLGCNLVNCDLGGLGNGRVSLETRQKISMSSKGRKRSDEARKAISEGKKGVPRPDISLLLKGRKHPPRSPEWSAKISASKKGRPLPAHVHAAALIATKGKRMTPEQIASRKTATEKRRKLKTA